MRGRDRDLLFDSGLGHVSLRRHVPLVSERKLVCVASHTHFDHIGCHHEFPDRCVHRAEAADPRRSAQRMDARRPLRDRRDVRSREPEGWDAARYRIAAGAGRPHAGGTATWSTSATAPSRSSTRRATRRAASRSTSETTGILLSGDIVYDGPLIDDAYHSDVGDYLATLERMRGLDVSVVHGGHFPSFGPTRYRQLIDEYLALKRKPGCHL